MLMRVPKGLVAWVSGAVLLAGVLALPACTPKQVDTAKTPAASQPFNGKRWPAAERFIEVARTGDVDALMALLDPKAIADAPDGQARDYMVNMVIPCFQECEVDDTFKTTSVANDRHGQSGNAFYLYAIRKSGTKVPFVVYVVDVDGQPMVASILINAYVEGRHGA